MSHGISPSCNISTIIMGINWAGDQQVTKDKLITFVHWNLSTSSAALSSSVIKKPPSSYDLLIWSTAYQLVDSWVHLHPTPCTFFHHSLSPPRFLFSLSLSLFFISLPFLALSFSLTPFLSASLYLFLSLCRSISPSLLSPSLLPSLSFYYLSLSIFLPLFLPPLSLTMFIPLSLPPSISPLSLSLCLSLYLSLPLFLLSPPLSHYVYPCISPSLLPNPSLSPYPLYLPLSFPPPSLSLSLFLSLSFSLVLDFLLPSCVNIMHCLREWKFNTVNLFSTISAVCIV